MAANVTGDANPATLLRTYFDKALMARLEKELIWKDLVQEKVVPMNSGRVVAFHRIQNLRLSVVGITQTFGSAHSTVSGLLKGKTYIVDEVTAGLSTYGDDLEISELLMITSEPNPIPELQDIFFYNAAASIDQKLAFSMSGIQGETASGTVPSANYNDATVSVSVVWGDASATLTEATLDADIPTHRIAAETFNRAYANLRNDQVPFHRRFPGRYAAVISPGQASDLRLDGTFQEIALKGFKAGENKFEMAKVGDVFGCAVMESALTSASAGTVDGTNDQIHRGVVFSDIYYYNVAHSKGVGRPRVNFIPPSPSAADPMGNNGYMSWKHYWAGTVVNPLAGEIVKTATTVIRGTAGYDDVFAAD